jgi:hypothetical protein
MTAYDKWSLLDDAKFAADLATSSGVTLTKWQLLDPLAAVKAVAAGESVNWSPFSVLSRKKFADEANTHHV